ncbi:transposase family protein [Streptomyces sp. NPDC060322]|uniref:transposase family protein n=1 Tax=Streptomyces sp. NPDC060322 TaxID=3347097 RepID=UPI00364B1062
MARQDSRLRKRRGHDRLRAEGGGPGQQLVFTDRVIATLVVLRFQLPHAVLGVLYGVDRSTITRAVHDPPALGRARLRGPRRVRIAPAYVGRCLRLCRRAGR